jgi:uncharacterized membrane protein YphA (DoxX/SURF4 family)
VEAILLLGGLLLAVIFLGASLTKLNDQAGFKQTLVDFGIPLSFASPFGVLLPFAEPAVENLPYLNFLQLITKSPACWQSRLKELCDET